MNCWTNLTIFCFIFHFMFRRIQQSKWQREINIFSMHFIMNFISICSFVNQFHSFCTKKISSLNHHLYSSLSHTQNAWNVNCSVIVELLLRLTAVHTSSAAVCNRTSIMAGVVIDRKFPGDSLVPKHETNVIQFLQKYPNYNGDGVTIAILDSGVDPKASGLEVSYPHCECILEQVLSFFYLQYLPIKHIVYALSLSCARIRITYL